MSYRWIEIKVTAIDKDFPDQDCEVYRQRINYDFAINERPLLIPQIAAIVNELGIPLPPQEFQYKSYPDASQEDKT